MVQMLTGFALIFPW